MNKKISNKKILNGNKFSRKAFSIRFRIILGLLIIIYIAGFCNADNCYALTAYSSYTYDLYENPAKAPQAYLPKEVFFGNDLKVGRLNNPGDLFVGPDNNIYLLDSGNNRLIIFDENWNLLKILDTLNNAGKADSFKNPQGIYVSNDKVIYVADTENYRILILDENGNILKEIKEPKSDVISENFIFKPIRLVMDKGKRLYAVSQGAYEGLMEFDVDGNFTGFVGANRVTPNLIDYFWKRISTKEQRAGLMAFLPTEFNSVDVDSDGFIFATTGSIDYTNLAFYEDQNNVQPIRKLNPAGQDILRRTSVLKPIGDLGTEINISGTIRGPSVFIDVCVEDSGIYNCLDGKRGRIFTYNSDGDLLYVFGGLGYQKGTFRAPVAIDSLNDYIIVLDKTGNRITIFEPTNYGKLIKDAVRKHYTGKYDEATQRWQEILKLNANYDLAYVGVGKALLRQDKYKEALEMFRLGNHREYYSKAFKLYRKQVVGENFGLIVFSVIAVIFILRYIRKLLRHGRKSQSYLSDVYYKAR